MLRIIHHIRLLALCVAITTSWGCTRDQVDDAGGAAGAKVALQVGVRAAGENFTSVRFIVLNHGTVVKNEVVTGTNSKFPLSIISGNYRLLVVANETEQATTALDAAKTIGDLRAVRISPYFSEENVMLTSINDIEVSPAPGGAAGAGQMSIDGALANTSPEITLQRVHAKTTLFVRKYTQKNGQPADRFTIKKVTLCQIPQYSYLLPGTYTDDELTQHVLYENATGIPFNSDVTQSQYAIKNNPEAGGYTSVVAAISPESTPGNIFPEYLFSDPTAEAKAAYLLVEAVYSREGINTDVTYTVPPLRANEQIENYNLSRNTNYVVCLTITDRGVFNAFEIGYSILDWEGREIDVDINKDPFLDITNIDVCAYDAAVTRVYFYSNQPADKVRVEPLGHLGTASGSSVELKGVFQNLVATDTELADNFHYEFDTTTGVGKGYMDIVNLNTSTAGRVTRVINLSVGTLVRTINVTSVISEEAAKQNTTPYVGVFHRANQHSERIVTWHASGAWTATIRNGNTNLASDSLVIDRLASPAFDNGLYTQKNPMKPEGAEVTDGTVLRNGERTLSGRGRVYFRVGWRDEIAADANRYVLIDVTYNDGLETVTLYCRQGQEPEALVENSTIKMAGYNVALPYQFTDYPTQTGYFYQWNDLTPWSPVGSVANYNTSVRQDTFDPSRSVCPDKYGYFDVTTVEKLTAILQNLMPLWGYYADGYFDRRAITSNAVNGSGVDVAYAGNLFYNPSTGKSIFVPTSGERTPSGEYRPVTNQETLGTDILLTSGYWADYSDDQNPNKAVMFAQYSGISIPAKKSVRDKLTALSVRCVRKEGNTLYFDANGGDGAPRSITKPEGTFVEIPGSPSVSLSPWHEFNGWCVGADGTGTVYAPGNQIAIGNQDKTLYALWKTAGTKQRLPQQSASLVRGMTSVDSSPRHRESAK